MARWYGRRRVDPRAEERREYERREQARFDLHARRLHRLLRQFRRVPLDAQESDYAWKQREIRDWQPSRNSRVILRTDGKTLFLQQQGAVGWRFYRLVPRYSVLREREHEPERGW